MNKRNRHKRCNALKMIIIKGNFQIFSFIITEIKRYIKEVKHEQTKRLGKWYMNKRDRQNRCTAVKMIKSSF